MSTTAAPRSLGPAVARLFEANFRHSKGEHAGRPFVLEPWQREDLDLIYEINEEGRRAWRKVLYGVARGNGKSPVAAGMGLVELLSRRDSPDVFCAAGKREQAAIVHEFAQAFVRGGPLRDYLRVLRHAIVDDRTRGSMRTVSADGYTAHGLSLSAGLRDELHAWRTDRQEELYWALETSSHKRPDSVLVDVSTAGWDKASLLGERYEAAMESYELEEHEGGFKTVGRDRESGSLMIWRGAPDDADPGDPAVWRAANPASWIALEDLERLARTLPENVFRRLHLNQWTESEDNAFRPAEWDACYEEGVGIPDGVDVTMGVDIGEHRDSSAVVVVWKRPEDGRKVLASYVLEPRSDGTSLLPHVESLLLELCTRWQHLAVGFDPWQFRRSAQLLASQGLRMVEAPQTDSVMVPASQGLHDLITSQGVAHDGDRVLRRHVLAAEAKQTSRGGWRIVKPLGQHGRRVDEARRVDAAVALAIAAHLSEEEGDRWGII